MTGAELKVALGGLGLPPSWFADRCHVTMRTVVRWFDGEGVSPEITAEVIKLEERTLAEMQKMVAAVEPDVDGDIVLRTYRTDEEYHNKTWPASWHRQLTFRLREHFEAQGNIVVVEYV